MAAAAKAFREPNLVVEPADLDVWSGFEARRQRYALFWAMFENTAYRDIHSWARGYRVKHELYRAIRSIYNPSYRLVTFHQTHIWGGYLDPKAGDGKGEPSALPIVVGEKAESVHEQLRMAIAQLWKASNWQVKKDVVILQGAIKGDILIEVVDDTLRGDVYMRTVQPDIVSGMELDPFGHVKAYTIEEQRQHPEAEKRKATYREEVTRDGDNVVYRTFLDGKPYDWYRDNAEGQPARGAEWQMPYGFIPMVYIPHVDVGLEWGWSELHADRPKFHEADDLASKLHDQIRKMVDSPWLLSGVEDPNKRGRSTPRATSRDSKSYQESDASLDRPKPGREEVPIFYGPEGSRATPLVAPLDIGATLETIRELLTELERDYPELQADIATAAGGASGRALRVARQRAESKVRQRRATYDRGLVHAQQMAIAIGGYQRYEGYEGFDLGSYDRGTLDHSIGKRPVFAQDPLDDLEVTREFWTAAEQAGKSGVPLRAFLVDQEWSQERIERLMAIVESDPDTMARRAQQQAAFDLVSQQQRGEGPANG